MNRHRRSKTRKIVKQKSTGRRMTKKRVMTKKRSMVKKRRMTKKRRVHRGGDPIVKPDIIPVHHTRYSYEDMKKNSSDYTKGDIITIIGSNILEEESYKYSGNGIFDRIQTDTDTDTDIGIVNEGTNIEQQGQKRKRNQEFIYEDKERHHRANLSQLANQLNTDIKPSKRIRRM